MMAKGNGHSDPRVTSLDDARKRAAEKAKAEKRAGQPSWTGPNLGPQGPRTMRDWIIGGVIIVMALGFVVSLVMRGAQMFGGG
jgi:anti-sigma factor RsiW